MVKVKSSERGSVRIIGSNDPTRLHSAHIMRMDQDIRHDLC